MTTREVNAERALTGSGQIRRSGSVFKWRMIFGGRVSAYVRKGPPYPNGVLYRPGQLICGSDGPKITEFFDSKISLVGNISEYKCA